MLHMADMHLDWPFTAMGADGRRSSMRREELRDVFAEIISLAQQSEVQVLLIAGDLFELSSVTRPLLQFIDRQFRRIPGIRIFISPGNHDPFLPDSPWGSYAWAPNVHIFGPGRPERVDLPDLPVSVSGWGFGAWEVRESRLGEFPPFERERINLAVLHGGEGAYQPFLPAELARLGADYAALGHIHKQGVVLEQAGRVIARYSGSPEALSFGEPGEHGIYLGTVSKLTNQMAFMPTGRRRYSTQAVDVTGAVSLEDLAKAALAVDSPENRQQHCYRLALSGAVDPELVISLPLLQEKLAGEFFFVKLLDQTEPDYDLPALALEKSARGLFVRKLLGMAQTAPDQRQRIRRALALGLAAFEGRGAR